MNGSAKADALAEIAAVSEISPDVRLGQLLAHLGMLGEDDTGRTLWDLDDEQLLAAVRRHRAELAARTQAGSAACIVVAAG